MTAYDVLISVLGNSMSCRSIQEDVFGEDQAQEATPAAADRRRHVGQWLLLAFSFPARACGKTDHHTVCLGAMGMADPDIWWHLRNGRSDLSRPPVSAAKYEYSFTAAGHPWINTEWFLEECPTTWFIGPPG